MIPGSMGHAWCGTCKRMAEVMDTYTTGPLGAEYVAQPLACGHDAGDGGHEPKRKPVPTVPSLLERLVAAQDKARAAGVVSR